MVRELAVALSLLPLAYDDLRRSICPQVAVSDASSTGGGICVSAGLTVAGEAAARTITQPQRRQAESSFLLVSAFDGVGGLRRAWSLLRVPVAGYVSIECDPSAVRVVQSAWPHA